MVWQLDEFGTQTVTSVRRTLASLPAGPRVTRTGCTLFGAGVGVPGEVGRGAAAAPTGGDQQGEHRHPAAGRARHRTTAAVSSRGTSPGR